MEILFLVFAEILRFITQVAFNRDISNTQRTGYTIIVLKVLKVIMRVDFVYCTTIN